MRVFFAGVFFLSLMFESLKLALGRGIVRMVISALLSPLNVNLSLILRKGFFRLDLFLYQQLHLEERWFGSGES